MVWEAETWRSAQHPGRPPDHIKGEIGGFVLHKLCHTLRFLLDNDSLADLPIYRYSKGKKA